MRVLDFGCSSFGFWVLGFGVQSFGQHGREIISTEVGLRLIQRLVGEGKGEGEVYESLPDMVLKVRGACVP